MGHEKQSSASEGANNLPDSQSEANTQSDAHYGARYFDNYSGGAYEYAGRWEQWFSLVAARIIAQFNPRTVLDVGCAKGFLVRALRERGVEAYGIDASEYAIEHADSVAKPFVSLRSATDPIEGRYDLITCIEVVEHLEQHDLQTAIEQMCSASDRILLSSTDDPNDHADPTHVSMQPRSGWARLFASAGFLRNMASDVAWLTRYSAVYERRPAPLSVPEVVSTYESALERVERELAHTRDALLDLDAKASRTYESEEQAELRSRAGSAADLRARLEAVEAELRARTTDLLRLRDQLITSDRLLGQAKGEVAVLEDKLRAYDDLRDAYHGLEEYAESMRIQHRDVVTSTTWRAAWAVLTPYRKLRSRRVP